MKGQLEELGEETDENVENISKMQGQILNMTGGKVNIFDASGNFKSTYEIMKGIAEVWDDLSSIDQANLLETIAGKHRANDVAALLSNWENVEAAVKSASEAEGSAARENAKYIDSIQGRLDKLTTAWQSFANTFMSSDFLKGVISGLTTFVELIEKLVYNVGTLGTIGLGAGIFGIFKNRSSFSGILGSLSTFGQLASDAWRSGGKLTTRFKDIGKAAGMAGGDIAKSFTGSLSGMIGGIGLAIAAIGLIVNAYKNYKEEISRARQETIQASDEFLDASNSFEQAYIKYSGRTDLTTEEETELETAIKGTVDALGDKSSALQNAVNSSNDYVASLEQIANAEIKETARIAKAKRDAAENELKEAALGYETFDGSEVDIVTLNEATGAGNKEAANIAKEMGSKFLKVQDVTTARSPRQMESFTFTLSGDANVDEITEYYYTLLEYQEKLSDADLIDTSVYDNVTIAIDRMKEAIAAYESGVVDAAKAQYQLAYGIPKTTEAYLKMRESVLNEVGGTVDTRKVIAGSLDSEYGQMFDLTTNDVQSRKLIGILDEYSDKEAGQIETFLNMRTAVNNNECTVGDYMSQFDDINTMTKDWSDEAKGELNTSFGIDTDTIKKQYDEAVTSYMRSFDKASGNLTGIQENFEKNFLDGLSASELAAVVSLKTEIDWQNDNFDDIIKQIEEEAALIEAISFSVNIELEAEKLENLSTAISESVSVTGLSTESISLVEDMFGDLDGYDKSALFERTANGIRLNSDELRKLNDEYKKTNVDGLDGKIDALGEKYNQTKEELYNLTYGTDEYNQKARELSDIEAQINAAEKLAAQYSGLASAYQEWQRVESAGSQRDMYEGMIEGFETVGDEISRGWLDDGTIEFLELIKGEKATIIDAKGAAKEIDIATASAQELKQVWKDLDKNIKHTSYSVRDFFTVDEDGNSTSQGVYNFLDAIGQMEEEKFGGKDVVKRKDGKIIGFDFQIAGGDKAIAEALGISEELVQIMKRAADDAGFVVSMDGTYQQLDVLKKKAAEAAKELKETFKATKYTFFQDGSEKGIKKDYDEALKVWETFKKNKKEDGTIDMSVKGAEEAYTLVSTLQSMVDQLSEPVYMELNASQVEKDMQTPLSKLQEYETLVQTEHQLQLKGTDTSQIEADKEEIINYFDELQENKPEIAAELGIEGLSRDEIEKKIESGEIKIPATIDLQVEMNNTLRDMVNIALYNAGLLGDKNGEGKTELEKRVDISVYADKVDTSDVEEKTEDAVDKATDGDSAREKNIEIIAKTFGVENVDDLSSKLKGLDDKTIQAIAEVLGQVDVDKLKLALGTMNDVQIKAIAEAIGKGDVDALKTAIGNLDSNTVQAIAEAFGYSDVNELNTAIENLDPKTVQAIAQALGLGDVNTLQITINNMHGNTVDAKVDTSGQKEKINTLQGWINSLKGRIVTVGVQLANAGKKKAAQRTGADLSPVNGTANVNGTTGRAFKQGSWGTKNSGTALVGELGREVLVRDGRYYTIGDTGAEFIKYKKGDIIFNHVQSEQLFRNGKVTAGGGRAKAFVNGTAFVGGNYPISGAAFSGTAKDGMLLPEKDSTSVDSNTENKFEEVIDWIETILDRAERAIDKYEQQANNVYKTWAKRNKALENEIAEVNKTISLYEQAKNKYLSEANKVGLDEKWAKKVREGSISIDDENDFSESTYEKIKEYQEWYEKALDCKDAIEELKETEASLYAQRVENVAAQYEGILGVIEHEKNMLDEYISQSEAQGWLVSAKYYDALANNERDNIANLKKQKSAMLTELQTVMESGTIAKGSEAWYDMVASIDEVTVAITEGETALLEYQQTIQHLKWETFDLLQEKISAVTEEADFLIELMSNDKLFDDNGQLTKEGSATIGLHGQNYNTYMYQADLAAKEAARLKAELANDTYDTELESRYREMISLQQEHILAAEGEKEAIRDMVSEGIEFELDALQERIDKYNEALDSQKDLYDYQKRVKEQTKEIASIEKQIASYSGDNSEEAKAKVQELKVSLEDAKADLEETEYDKYISDQQKLLDELYLEYETVLNERLDNVDALISDMIAQINADAALIGDTITENANAVGYTLSNEMNSIWNSSTTSINGVISEYGIKFSDSQTTTNLTLNAINTNLQSMITQLNTIAKTKIKSASVSSAANSNQAKPPKTETPKEEPKETPKTIKVGGKINAGNAPIYDYAGAPAERQLYRNDPIYTVLSEKDGYILTRWHKLSSGASGWFKKSDVKALATGAKKIDANDMAWTQEKGQEYIVRPSDGAILTPVAKGDSVLTAQASNNIWQMANSPAEFIKDNLNLGSASVPNNSTVQNSYTQHLDKVVFSFPNVKNYDEMLSAMQKDPNFERLVESMSIGKLAGKSSLAKGKAIR